MMMYLRQWARFAAVGRLRPNAVSVVITLPRKGEQHLYIRNVKAASYAP
jgi:hypothetical protein